MNHKNGTTLGNSKERNTEKSTHTASGPSLDTVRLAGSSHLPHHPWTTVTFDTGARTGRWIKYCSGRGKQDNENVLVSTGTRSYNINTSLPAPPWLHCNVINPGQARAGAVCVCVCGMFVHPRLRSIRVCQGPAFSLYEATALRLHCSLSKQDSCSTLPNTSSCPPASPWIPYCPLDSLPFLAPPGVTED